MAVRVIDGLLSAQDVSDLTKWAVMTVYRKSLKGEIPGRITFGKRSVRFQESRIKAWLEEYNTEDSEKNTAAD